MKKKRIIIGTLIAGLIIFFLYQQMDFDKLEGFQIKINYYLLISAFLVTLLSTLIRAKRFNFVLTKPLKLTEIFKITSFYNLSNGLFPGGLGELSFAYLIRKKVEKPLAIGLSAVVITRLFDVLIISIFLLASLFLITGFEFGREKYVLFAAIIIIILILIIRYIEKIVEVSSQVLKRINKNQFSFLNKLKENLELVATFLKENKNKNKIVLLFFITLLLWSFRFLITQLIFNSFGLGLSYPQAVLMGAIATMITIIPINTFAGFGYKEGALAGGLIFLGVAKEEAIIYSFLNHLIALAFIFGTVFFALLLGLKFFERKLTSSN